MRNSPVPPYPPSQRLVHLQLLSTFPVWVLMEPAMACIIPALLFSHLSSQTVSPPEGRVFPLLPPASVIMPDTVDPLEFLIFIYLAGPALGCGIIDLCCGMQDLSTLHTESWVIACKLEQMVGLSFPGLHWTWVPVRQYGVSHWTTREVSPRSCNFFC